MRFASIKLQDKNKYDEYLNEYKFNTYEYSFTTLYMWREYLNIEISFNESYIAIKKNNQKHGKHFMEPIGYSDMNELKNIVDKMTSCREQFNLKYLFGDVEEEFLKKLIELFGERVQYTEDMDNFDYVYRSNELSTLEGKKFRKKRNRYNLFLKSYEDITFCIDNYEKTKIRDCEELAQKWYDGCEEKSEEIYYELIAVKDLLKNIDSLGVKLITVYDKEELIGFSFGEKIRDDFALIYIEKCNKDYNGIYEYINKTFIENGFNETEFVNRGEDLGIMGLRVAKQRYNPVKLEKKYLVNII